MASDKKIVLITGGNTGLGLEIVRALCRTDTPYEIIIGCRTPSKGEAAADTVRRENPGTPSTLSVVPVDLTSDGSLEQAVASIASRHGRLDVLLNNAGGSFDPAAAAGRMSVREAFRASWDVNVAGTHVLTTLAVPLLLRSADPRLVFMASGMASLAGTEDFTSFHGARINPSPPAGWPKTQGGSGAPFPGQTAYRASKAGLNMLMREWVRTLRNDGVKVWAVSPGFLATGLGGMGPEKMKAMGAVDPSVGGNFVKDVVEGKRDHDVGKVIRSDVVQPW
ncbi:NAD(P)-binding protein [Xylariomycetidae sp. FL2044]|nr:NAD(P)-binding protein [Xylariomycetidae sp. FL2044]